jgi:hypothetical protein
MLEKKRTGPGRVGDRDGGHFEMEAVVASSLVACATTRPTSPPSGKIRGVGRRGSPDIQQGAAGDGALRHLLIARHPDNTILGVLGMAAPGRCQPNAKQRMQLTLRPAAARSARTLPVTAVGGHLGKTRPGRASLAPRPRCGGRPPSGHGHRLQADAGLLRADGRRRRGAYLETDKPENVRFYERFGFEVVGEEEVIGVPNWYMARPANARGASKAL